MWRSIGKGVLFKTFDVKVQVQKVVPELWRQTFWKVLIFLMECHIYLIGELLSYVIT